ncbi:hypothetical protein Mal48_17510 [Thalassoglobus polymorphus]|uniref:Uncharacterized protein n=1 Tax=Thalassoglobus polymorphus TaxID=2527994 RepID=A0A517QLJ8_9PLAN|nr:hypothetical protein Mal48_17510 [Thalassoglobus polymorphus]
MTSSEIMTSNEPRPDQRKRPVGNQQAHALGTSSLMLELEQAQAVQRPES